LARLFAWTSSRMPLPARNGVWIRFSMSGLIFGLPSRLPASTALLSPGRIRLPLQEQIDFIAKCCGALRGADRAPALPRARGYRKVSSEGFSPSEPHAVKQSLGIGMRGSVEKRSSLIHFDYLTASHDRNLIASERQSQDRRLRSIGRLLI
jgi:hypothetical protein